jgi:hypothetical protein
MRRPRTAAAFEQDHGVALYPQRGGLETVTPLAAGAGARYELPGLAASSRQPISCR